MMKTTTLGRASLSLACFFVLMSTAFSAGKGFEGFWDLTEVSGSSKYASWIEVKQSGSGWTGRYLHRGGHALPAEVQVVNGELSVKALPDGETPVGPNTKFPFFTAKLEGDTLKGSGTDRRGGTFTFTGVRSPDRLEGSDRKVNWGKPIALFDGKDLSEWTKIGSRESNWKVVNGEMVSDKTGANIRTVRTFRDFKLHIEFKIPKGSNSGIYFRGRYETQVADNYGEETHSRRVGGIYGLIKPLVNAAKPAGEWNTVDATLIGYRLTLVVNGQTTIDGQLIDGITGGALDCNEGEPGPIMLQGDHGPVSYRNIVITPAD